MEPRAIWRDSMTDKERGPLSVCCAYAIFIVPFWVAGCAMIALVVKFFTR